MALLDLPQELLSHILAFLEPEAIIHLGRTCKHAYEVISPRNQILWKSAFLHIFDDPNDAWSAMPGSPQASDIKDWNWHRELVRRMAALRAIRSTWRSIDEHTHDEEHLEALLSILDTAKYAPTPRELASGRVPMEDDRKLSLNLQVLADTDHHRPGLESVIHDSGLVSRYKNYAGSDGNPWNSPRKPMTRSMTSAENEAHRPESASRLHVLYGLTVRERIEHRARGAARRKVYNWALSGPDNDHGPFKRDGSGRVDWALLEGIYSVIARNFSLCVQGQISMPQGFCFSIPHRTLADPTTPADWARVAGPWLGTYSFLDYADLFAFNTWNDQHGPRPTLEDEPEACGDLMKLDLKLDDTYASDPRLQTALPISTALPPLFFTGLSRAHAGMHRPAIGLRGCVYLVPGAREVRWRFIISYAGEDQWQLEGVQPGGVRSGGVFGLWSQCNHEENGPVGSVLLLSNGALQANQCRSGGLMNEEW